MERLRNLGIDERCESCAVAGEHRPATHRSTNPDWSHYVLCADCAQHYDGEPPVGAWEHIGEAGEHAGHHLHGDDMQDVHCLECAEALGQEQAEAAWPIKGSAFDPKITDSGDHALYVATKEVEAELGDELVLRRRQVRCLTAGRRLLKRCTTYWRNRESGAPPTHVAGWQGHGRLAAAMTPEEWAEGKRRRGWTVIGPLTPSAKRRRPNA